MATNFNQLSLEIAAYMTRNDSEFIVEIPGFINKSIERISRESKNLLLQSYIQTISVINDQFIIKPANWRRNLSMQINDTNVLPLPKIKPIRLKTLEYLNSYDQKVDTGLPIYYADFNMQTWQISPIPDQAYTLYANYLGIPAYLSVTNQTNVLTEYAPDILFTCSLIYANIFVKDFEKIGYFEDLYRKLMSALEIYNEQRYYDRQSQRESG